MPKGHASRLYCHLAQQAGRQRNPCTRRSQFQFTRTPLILGPCPFLGPSLQRSRHWWPGVKPQSHHSPKQQTQNLHPYCPESPDPARGDDRALQRAPTPSMSLPAPIQPQVSCSAVTCCWFPVASRLGLPQRRPQPLPKAKGGQAPTAWSGGSAGARPHTVTTSPS